MRLINNFSVGLVEHFIHHFGPLKNGYFSSIPRCRYFYEMTSLKEGVKHVFEVCRQNGRYCVLEAGSVKVLHTDGPSSRSSRQIEIG